MAARAVPALSGLLDCLLAFPPTHARLRSEGKSATTTAGHGGARPDTGRRSRDEVDGSRTQGRGSTGHAPGLPTPAAAPPEPDSPAVDDDDGVPALPAADMGDDAGDSAGLRCCRNIYFFAVDPLDYGTHFFVHFMSQSSNCNSR